MSHKLRCPRVPDSNGVVISTTHNPPPIGAKFYAPDDVAVSPERENCISAFRIPQSYSVSAGARHSTAVGTEGDTVDPSICSDLIAGTPYKIWIIGFEDESYANSWVINGLTTTNVTQDGGTNQLFFNNSIGSSAQTFESYGLTVLPSAAGEIEITGNLGAATAGFAIQQVPEPGTGLLLGAGLLGLVARRRRR